MNEVRIKALLKKRLEAEGFHEVVVRRQAERGADVDAKFPGYQLRLIGEVKGEPSKTIVRGERAGQLKASSVVSNQYRHWLAEALWELVNRMNEPSGAVFAIFLPDSTAYRRLVSRIPPRPLQALGVQFVFVGDDRLVRFDPQTRQLGELRGLRDLKGGM